MKGSVAYLAAAAVLGLLLAPVPAHAAAPAGRYTASEGVVKDNKTGLYWQQTAAPTTYDFSAATTYCSNNAPGLSGSGWRLPEIKELLTLVDDSVGPPGPTIDTSAFPATPAGMFWSSPVIPGYRLMVVSFSDGTSYFFPSSPNPYVRCVR